LQGLAIIRDAVKKRDTAQFKNCWDNKLSMLTENSALYFTENWYEIFGNFLFWSCQGQNQCPRRDYWARPHQVAAYNYIGDCIKEQNEEGDESIVIHII
jgi:maltose-binding protein MalE